ncbi:hypothetical protein BDZ45DRAFT_741629 [Acephala macrosclerotiorum]|nr:hypothetical protein BDZ45DRAFT_741629 [Acephala macrosclerotiorum]
MKKAIPKTPAFHGEDFESGGNRGGPWTRQSADLEEGGRSNATQLAALQTILQTISLENDLPITIQDPQYTEIGGSFLQSLGYTVVDDPEAF